MQTQYSYIILNISTLME